MTDAEILYGLKRWLLLGSAIDPKSGNPLERHTDIDPFDCIDMPATSKDEDLDAELVAVYG